MSTSNTETLSGGEPLKSQKFRRRPVVKKDHPGDNEEIDTDLTPEDIRTLIRDALDAHIIQSKNRVYKEECAKAVVNVLSEFLQSYILIGYDFEGTPMRITAAHNNMEADALAQAVQKYLIQMGDGYDKMG